jgi:hypothetical protein
VKKGAKNMSDPIIVDLTTISRTFPEIIYRDGKNYINGSIFIERDHVLDTMCNQFQEGVKLLTIEGDEGIGKTTLLGELAIKNPANTISVFIKPTNRWSYDFDNIIYDLANQVNWILSNQLLPYEACIDQGYLNNLFSRLIM